MQMLKAKLMDLERRKRDEEIASIKGEQRNVGFGSQIRSYVLHPYQMVKDLRTSHSTGNVDNVLSGDLDPFMISWLHWHRASGAGGSGGGGSSGGSGSGGRESNTNETRLVT